LVIAIRNVADTSESIDIMEEPGGKKMSKKIQEDMSEKPFFMLNKDGATRVKIRRETKHQIFVTLYFKDSDNNWRKIEGKVPKNKLKRM